MARPAYGVVSPGEGGPSKHRQDSSWEIGRSATPWLSRYHVIAIAELYRRNLLDKIREDHKVRSMPEGTLRFREWNTAHLAELVNLLDNVKAYNDAKDLDR